MVWPPKRTLTESEREHYVEPPIILPPKFWQRKVTGKNKKSILTHNRRAIHTSVNWSKWDMGEIFGLKFQLLYLHTFKPWINTIWSTATKLTSGPLVAFYSHCWLENPPLKPKLWKRHTRGFGLTNTMFHPELDSKPKIWSGNFFRYALTRIQQIWSTF